MAADLKRLNDRRGRLIADRATYEPSWREILDLFCPRRGNILSGSLAGTKQTSKQIRACGELAARDLANFLQTNLTNAAQRWVSFQMRQKVLNSVNSVQNFLDNTAQAFLDALNASNFVTEIGEWFMDFGTISTAVMMKFKVREAPPGQFGGWLFQTLAPGSYCIAENASGIVDTIFYDVQMSIRAAHGKWGDKIGKDFVKKLEKSPDEMMTISRAIYPRNDRNPRMVDNLNMPFASVVWNAKQSDTAIDEGGFKRFPAIVGRFYKASGETYGRGPGHMAIGEMNSANRAREYKLHAFAMDLIPPVYEKEGAIIGSHVLEPGARNVVRGNKDSVWTTGSGSRFDVTTIVEKEMEDTIKRCFFVDQIRALPPPDKPSYMTAYEVAMRYQETFRALGSAFGQATIPLNHLVETGVQDLADDRALPDVPPELAVLPDADVDIAYQGPMALAQKAADVNAIELEVGWVSQLKAQHPNDPVIQQLTDNYKWDAIVQHKALVRGIPANLMSGLEEVARTRVARAQEQEAMAKQQAILAASQTMRNAAPMVQAMQPQGSPA